jgi:site-specific recombinase XerD
MRKDSWAKVPSALTLADLDTAFVGRFLDHLEQDRSNTARSRNVRLAAIHSFFRYVALHAPEHSALASRVLAMPSKFYLSRPIDFLTPAEVAALLAAPDLGTGGALGPSPVAPRGADGNARIRTPRPTL